jgi:uncharacterized protein (TIGR02270 family)
MSGERTDIRAAGMADRWQQHLEEIAFLWEQRQDALHSPEYATRDVQQLDQRIAAHADGLRTGGESATAVLTKQLESDEPATVSAAAWALLGMGTAAAAAAVIEAFTACAPEKLAAFRQALCHGPVDLLEEPLRAVASTAPAPIAAATMEALVFHRQRPPSQDRWSEFATHPDPQVRRTAWRIAAMRDCSCK